MPGWALFINTNVILDFKVITAAKNTKVKEGLTIKEKRKVLHNRDRSCPLVSGCHSGARFTSPVGAVLVSRSCQDKVPQTG